jgi:hypothetical protein
VNLTKYLIDELVDDLPEPLVGKIQDKWLVGTQDAVEQVAVVVIRLEPETKVCFILRGKTNR